MMASSTLFVSALWLMIMFIGTRILAIRTHGIEAHIFIEYAKGIFTEHDDNVRADEIANVSSDFRAHRLNCSKRFLLIHISQVFVCFLILATVFHINIFILNLTAAVAVIYSLAAYSQSLMDRALIDSVCNKIDTELKNVGCMNAYSEALEQHHKKGDPPDNANNG